MAKLVVSEFITLDGVIEDPGGGEGTPNGGWSFKFPAPGSEQYKFEELQASDAQLLGRITYEGFAAAWPSMEDVTGDFGKKMNAMPKVVVSTTLTEPTWQNSTILADDIATGVRRLKAQYEGDILVAGSASLVDTLRQHDLIDEYRLMVFPIVLGRGKRLFDGQAPATVLELVGSQSVGPNVVVLTYRPSPSATDLA